MKAWRWRAMFFCTLGMVAGCGIANMGGVWLWVGAAVWVASTGAMCAIASETKGGE